MHDFEKLVEIQRGGLTESEHWGAAVLINSKGIKKSIGNPKVKTFTRSIIKPIQAKIALESLNQNLDLDLIAIACASHNNEKEQIVAINKLMNKFGLQESDLFCGSITHNCAGKHCLLCAASQNYSSASSTIQNKIYKELQKLNPTLDSIPIASDGCGLNTFYMSLEDIGVCFLSLIQDESYSLIIKAMNEYPWLIGGRGQFDSALMSQYPNQFIAKGGAEGLMMIANLNSREVIILKIADGSKRAKFGISTELIKSLNWIDNLEYDSNIYTAQAAIAGELCVLAGF